MTTVKDQIDNPTRKWIAETVSAGEKNIPLHVNPAFESLRTVLLGGVPGEVSIGFHAPAFTIQGGGVVGGGTLANMLDCAMAVAVLSRLDAGLSCTTTSLSVNMMRGAAAGDFRAEALVEQLGRRMAFASARLFDADGRLVANATSSLAVLTA